MATQLSDILDATRQGFELQAMEINAARALYRLVPVVQRATGSANIDEVFSLDGRFRLVFVRCHFAGGSGSAALSISLDSVEGAAYDTRLFTMTQAGVDHDVQLRIAADELAEPSAWVFQPADAIRVQWANPDSGQMTWGLEVGLVLAS